MTAKIVSNNLKNQSFVIQEKIKERKLRMIKKRQLRGPEISQKSDDDFDYVDVDQMNATSQSILQSDSNFEKLDKNYAKDATNGNFGGSLVANAPKLLKFQSSDRRDKEKHQINSERGSLLQNQPHHTMNSPDISKISNPNQSTYMTNNLNTSNPLVTPTKAVLAKNAIDQSKVSSGNSGTNIL